MPSARDLPLLVSTALASAIRVAENRARCPLAGHQAAVAQRKLVTGEGREKFYRAKLDTDRFFMTRMLPETPGLDARIRAGAAPIMAPDDDMG